MFTNEGRQSHSVAGSDADDARVKNVAELLKSTGKHRLDGTSGGVDVHKVV